MSVTVGKIRRTETERIEYFRNQPESGTLEPHRAFCTRCNKFVNLGRKQTYAVRPWETHRSKCDQRVQSSNVCVCVIGKHIPISFFVCNSNVSDNRSQSEQVDEECDDASTVDRSASRRAPRKSTAERKAILEADSRVAIVKSDEVKCRKCEKWIRLSNTMEYAPRNWKKHALVCCDAVYVLDPVKFCKTFFDNIDRPSSRVATATRKLQLVNDSQAKSFGIHNVHCASCNRDVDLGHAIDYDLTKWEDHKTQCHW